MNKIKRQNLVILIVSILLLSIAIPFANLQSADAHTPPWKIISYAYMVPAPNPVGVGQTIAIVMWIDDPLPSATVTNDIRRHDYTLTITAPSGKIDSQHWDVIEDTTSVQYYQYTPSEIGEYTLKFDYPEQTYEWSGAYQGDIFTAASKTITLTVQEEPIPANIDSYPLPTEYWTRPIEGQNTYWFSIASNWLGRPYITGAGASYGIPGAYQPYGQAPNSAHVMWTKPIQFGGVVGGADTAIPGEMYYSGLSYNVRFGNPIIMQGMLFYQEPYGNAGGSGGLFGTGGDYVAVNLQTGQEEWRIDPAATGTMLVPSFGYLYSYENENQHGVLPNGLLVAPYTYGGTPTPFGMMGGISAWAAYDPSTGKLTSMNITNIPSGVATSGPSGEYLIYTLTNLGSNSNPNWYLAQWNSSNVFGGNQGMMGAGNWYSGTVNANTPSAYDWNISIPSLKGTGWNVGQASLSVLPLVSLDNMMLLTQGSFGGHPGDYGATITTDPGNITAISLQSGSTGHVLWSQTYQPEPGNNTRLITEWDPDNGVFIFADKETMTHSGYSLNNGNQLWGPTVLTDDFTTDYNYMAIGLERAAYGKLYYAGYAGILYCYDTTNGDLLWTYGNGGEGNSTLSGFVTPYGRYPIFVSVVADGKVYLDTTEHSPNSPLYKGAQYRCINATDGTELWTILDYGNQMYGGQAAVADGYLTTLNSYDSQIYCFGKGPSAMTVDAPTAAVQLGQSLVIRGTVTDIAAGTKQTEQAGRFPNGVPAVSDESQGAWMEYVYMQKPRPMDTVGVPVTISVVDANGNYRDIGTATSNSDGFYAMNWMPDIEGQYTVYASFAGSESYWPSHAVTSFAVDPAPATPSPTEAPLSSMADAYFVPAVAGIIIAIAIVGIVLALLLLRKRP
jgi:outer membrane protein assembly factor BamB